MSMECPISCSTARVRSEALANCTTLDVVQGSYIVTVLAGLQ